MDLPNIESWSRLADAQFSEHAGLVGIVAAQGAVLEAEIEMLFGTLIGSRYNQGKIIYYAMISLPPRLNMIQGLLSDNYDGNDELHKKWHDLRREIDRANGERNRCVHAIWAENPATRNLQRRTTHSNGSYERRRLDMSLDDLKKIGRDLAAIAGQVNQFSVLLRGMPQSPSPNK
ncbi:MAG: hypothetical protein JWQ76_5776 [Ramlibacter sp.]|nr:hypothetical protein [Ramlibacter sp.]